MSDRPAIGICASLTEASWGPWSQWAVLLPLDYVAAIGLQDSQAAGDEASAQLGDFLPERVCAELVRQGVPVRGLATVRPSLEELFVGLTGEGFDVGA